MFNHSTLNQNVGWTRDVKRQIITYRTLRDVAAGEELCISYGAPGQLTFVDAEAERVRMEEAEEARREVEEGGPFGGLELD
jgi:SET domain-containing protein